MDEDGWQQTKVSPWQHEMDDQTRLARFESMRKGAGPNRRLVTRNKKLFVIHKDLQKQCDKAVQRAAFDARVSTADINRQKMFAKVKLDKLAKLKQKCDLEREKTHTTLEKMSAAHAQRERNYVIQMAAEEKKSRDFDSDLVKSLGKLSMPRRMKKRLTATHLGIPYHSDDDS